MIFYIFYKQILHNFTFFYILKDCKLKKKRVISQKIFFYSIVLTSKLPENVFLWDFKIQSKNVQLQEKDRKFK